MKALTIATILAATCSVTAQDSFTEKGRYSGKDKNDYLHDPKFTHSKVNRTSQSWETSTAELTTSLINVLGKVNTTIPSAPGPFPVYSGNGTICMSRSSDVWNDDNTLLDEILSSMNTSVTAVSAVARANMLEDKLFTPTDYIYISDSFKYLTSPTPVSTRRIFNTATGTFDNSAITPHPSILAAVTSPTSTASVSTIPSHHPVHLRRRMIFGKIRRDNPAWRECYIRKCA